MELPIPHQIEFDGDGRIPLSDIARALISIDNFAVETGAMLESLVPGLTVEGITVSLKRLSHESPLRESIVTALVVAFQPSLMDKLPKAVEHVTGQQIPTELNEVVTLLFVLLLVFGAEQLVKITTGDLSSKHVKKVFDGLVTELSNKSNIPKAEIEAALEARYGKSKWKRIARWASDFFAPGKALNNSRATIDRHEIPQEAMAEIPRVVQLDDGDEVSEPYENVQIELHAQDVDRTKQGWAGVIPAISEDRMRMTLYPPLQPEDIYGKKRIVGDVIVVSKRMEGGELRPYLFHLVRLKN